MEFLPKEGYKRVLVIIIYTALAILATYLFFKYLLKLLLPFIIAWLVSLMIRPMAEVLHKRTRISKKIISVILVLILLLLIGGLIFIILDKIIYEFKGIIILANENAYAWLGRMMRIINGISEKLPFLKTFGSEEELIGAITDIAEPILEKFTANVPNMLKDLLTILPNALFVSLILIMASYYFCADGVEINKYFASLLPNGMKNKIEKGKNRVKQAGKNIVKGYLLTMGITFVQLYVGFLIIKSDYAFTIALLTSLVDVLPVIGVGTVIIPWATTKLIAGAYYQGFGLLIIFAVVSVVREIIEPKIIGKSIGLHPLATLFFMYIGLELCGFWGLIFFPVLVIVAKSLFADNKIKLTEDIS